MATLGATLSTDSYPSAGTAETVIPTTGNSITIGNSTNIYVINPAATLATLTVTMPATPVDRQKIYIVTSKILTSLTLSPNSNQSILNVPTTLALGGFCSFVYIAANTTWYRVG